MRSLQIKFTLMKITQHDWCKHFSSKREQAKFPALVSTNCLVQHHLIRPHLNFKIHYVQLTILYFIEKEEGRKKKKTLINAAAVLEACRCRNSEANASTVPGSTRHPHAGREAFKG